MSETTTTIPVEKTEPQNFSVDYVRELRAENKGYRLKAQELETKVQAMSEAEQKAASEWQSKMDEVHTTSQQRLIRAELKAHALKAGMVDLDGLKLLDLTKIVLTDDGEIDGAEALLEAAKKAKPWLFGQVSTTTSTATAPKPAEPKQKMAKDWSVEETRAFEKEHGIKMSF